MNSLKFIYVLGAEYSDLIQTQRVRIKHLWNFGRNNGEWINVNLTVTVGSSKYDKIAFKNTKKVILLKKSYPQTQLWLIAFVFQNIIG